MKIETAKSAGFCFGVDRAVNTVYQLIADNKAPIYTFGPIIHNEEVTNELEKLGVTIIHSEEELKKINSGVIVIRSHGVAQKYYSLMEKDNIEVVDATCPFVSKIHQYVKEYTKNNYSIIIIGDEVHPEVQGIYGWGNPNRTWVINTIDEIDKFSGSIQDKYCIVTQTTYNANKFKELVEKIREKGYDIIVLNTICNATATRQAEALALSRACDAMIVIGSKASSNTQKLFEICKDECENTYYIQTIDDMDNEIIQSYHSVGITAGASTPNKIIEEVQKYVRNEF